MSAKAKVIGPTGIILNSFQAEQVLRFAAKDATEEAPLKLGNVEFWIGEGAWRGTLIYSIPSYSWEKESVQSDLTAFLRDKDEELCAYLNTAA